MLLRAATRATRSVVTRAATSQSSSYERVLRYPDGSCRRMVYPTAPAEEAEVVWDEGDARYHEGNFWNENASSLWSTQTPVNNPPTKLSLQAQLPCTAQAPALSEQMTPTQQEAMFTFDWNALRKSAERLSARVSKSYEVLHGSPWVAPRPLYVLTVPQVYSDSAGFFTLRTRVQKQQWHTDELSKVLGNAALAASFNLSDMLDGVVCFTSKDDAFSFADTLASERGDEVSVVEVGSHDLFRLVGDAGGCVVAVKRVFDDSGDGSSAAAGALQRTRGSSAGRTGGSCGQQQEDSGWLPEPHQLAGALRGQAAWDDML